jgi:hypothetical protein
VHALDFLLAETSVKARRRVYNRFYFKKQILFGGSDQDNKVYVRALVLYFTFRVRPLET